MKEKTHEDGSLQLDILKKSNKMFLVLKPMKKRQPSQTHKTKPSEPEKELASWFKALRKNSLNLTQKELAERAGIPLGTIRYFEQTGRTSLQNFLRIATELHTLDLFLALARGEEPMTFQKIQKEKTISRLQDELAVKRKEATPMEIRKRNAFVVTNAPIRKWRMHGREKWIDAVTHTR
jgi:transcriptional regulator with XRE-family HTH domain